MQVVDHVAQSQYALQLLLPQADYAAALDIIADIQVSTPLSLHCCAHALAHTLCLKLMHTSAFMLAAIDRHAGVALCCTQLIQYAAITWPKSDAVSC